MEMEQQQQLLEPKLSKQPLWLDQAGEDDDEEEVGGVGQLSRHSKHSTARSGVTGNTLVTTFPSSGELESAATNGNGTTSEHDADQDEAAATADDSRPNEEDKVVKVEGDGVGHSVYFDKFQGIWKCRHCNWTHQIGSPCPLDIQNPKGYLNMALDTQTLYQWDWGPCFTLEAKGVESINEISEMNSEIPKILSWETNHQLVENVDDQNGFGLSQAPFEQSDEGTNASFKNFDNATNADVNANLIGEIEDLTELDVEKVIENQHTHDLYCPNCNSCITGRVILRRKKPRVSNIRRKLPKRVKKLDPIPDSAGDGRSGDTPEIDPHVNTTAPPDEQTEHAQEAFSCSSCFSLFIPIGNGCFKIFQFFRHGRQTEQARSPQEISQRENEQIPQEISQKEKPESNQGISSNEEHTANPSNLTGNEGPQKSSEDENMHGAPHISHNEDAQSPEHMIPYEDTQSPPKLNRNENTQSPKMSQNAESPKNIFQNENKQSPQTIPTAKTNWIFSVFGFRKGKETTEKVQAGYASSVQVQSATVTTLSITNVERVDGAAIKPKEPAGISSIFSSTDGSLLDKVKAVYGEKKPDADMLHAGLLNEIVEDIEAGLLEPTFPPGTEVEPSPLIISKTQNEPRGADAGEAHEWEILKSIVYGGLVESITSLGVVTSAAGAGANTLNVLALGVANLIGGLLVISHNLRELKNDQPRGASAEINIDEDRYQTLLGRRRNFVLHVIVVIVSFLIFGLVPPVVYGFSFRKSDDKDLKLAAVAGASLICIFLLALGKGHVRKPRRTYFQTAFYYVFLAITTSGISFVVGELIKKLLEKLGLFDQSSSAVSNMPLLETIPLEVGRASY